MAVGRRNGWKKYPGSRPGTARGAGVAGVVDSVFTVIAPLTGTTGVETIGVWSSSVLVEEISAPSCRIYLASPPQYSMKSQPTGSCLPVMSPSKPRKRINRGE